MDRELMRMKYAFALVFVKRIIEADNVIHPDEVLYFEEWFAPEILSLLSLTTKKELLHVYVQSLDVLPHALEEEQKKELFGLMLGACVADDFLDFREFGILEAAANVLLIEQEQMFAYIDFFLDADIQSNVELP